MNQEAFEDLLSNLAEVQKIRNEFADCLSDVGNIIKQAETANEKSSGKFNLDAEINDIKSVSDNLRQGVFRLLVLGDMKRGKSTLLNAILGENLLPSDVIPCTAILTIIRYSENKQVTVYFDNDTLEKLDFNQFKEKYTIDPNETKSIKTEKLFSNVKYAVVEYPLPLLSNGVEVVDSPGLNDTEARNDLTLGYINNCHAVLFVLSATQQCTKEERRYLENYLKDKGLSIFFIINRWDELRQSLFDPDDEDEVQKAEMKLRQVFKSSLYEYCQIEGKGDLYQQRVFEVSAKKALVKRMKEQTLEGTGLSELINSLDNFLVKERAISEFRKSKVLLRSVYLRVHESIRLRIPLLDKDVNQLKENIKKVEPEFEKLQNIRDDFRNEIASKGRETSTHIKDSLHYYLATLANNFESDFDSYLPEWKFMGGLTKGSREEFKQDLEKGFKEFLSDKMAKWTNTTEKELQNAFHSLASSALRRGMLYQEITETINKKVIDYDKLKNNEIKAIVTESDDKSPGWSRWASGALSLATFDLAGVGMASSGLFNWKNVLGNIGAIIGINALIYLASGFVLAPLGILLTGLLAGSVSFRGARKKLAIAMQDELKKELPSIARDKSEIIFKEVNRSFDVYLNEVMRRINEDIQSRKQELNSLVFQKENYEINRDAEIARLNHLDDEIHAKWQQLESKYDSLLNDNKNH